MPEGMPIPEACAGACYCLLCRLSDTGCCAALAGGSVAGKEDLRNSREKKTH